MRHPLPIAYSSNPDNGRSEVLNPHSTLLYIILGSAQFKTFFGWFYNSGRPTQPARKLFRGEFRMDHATMRATTADKQTAAVIVGTRCRRNIQLATGALSKYRPRDASASGPGTGSTDEEITAESDSQSANCFVYEGRSAFRKGWPGRSVAFTELAI
jgi:hypothetical protein